MRANTPHFLRASAPVRHTGTVLHIINMFTAVLAGVTTEQQLLSPDNKVHPDNYMNQLSDLLTIKDKAMAH